MRISDKWQVRFCIAFLMLACIVVISTFGSIYSLDQSKYNGSWFLINVAQGICSLNGISLFVLSMIEKKQGKYTYPIIYFAFIALISSGVVLISNASYAEEMRFLKACIVSSGIASVCSYILMYWSDKIDKKDKKDKKEENDTNSVEE